MQKVQAEINIQYFNTKRMTNFVSCYIGKLRKINYFDIILDVKQLLQTEL